MLTAKSPIRPLASQYLGQTDRCMDMTRAIGDLAPTQKPAM